MRELPDSIRSRLGAAAAVFASQGFDATRIEDLADATGVPKATLYYYFTGKEDILAHLLGAMLETVRDKVKQATSTPGTARERLERVVAAQLEVMAANPAACQALISELGRAGRIPETAAAINEAFHAPVQGLLADGVADRTLRKMRNPEATASAVYGAVTLAGLHEILVAGTLQPKSLARDVLALVLDGLATAAPAAGGDDRRARRTR